MSEYPSDWSVCSLGEVAERIRRTSDDQNLDVLTISSTEGWVDQKRKWARDMAGKSIEKYTLLERGEFSYNRGNSKTYPQGCIFRLESWDRALVPNVYHSFRIISPDIDGTFVQHFFAAGGLNEQLRSVITSSVPDNGLLNITADTFFASDLPIPPLPEQKKIAEILSGIDDSIRREEERLDALSCLLQSQLRSQRFSTGEMVTMAEACLLVADCMHKTPEFEETGFPIVRTPNVRDGELILEGMKFISEASYQEWIQKDKPEPGDILFTREAPLGEACLVPKNFPLCIGQRMMLLRANPRILSPEFLLFRLRSLTTQRKLQLLSGGSTVGHTNVKDIRSLEIEIPNASEQRDAVSLYEAISKSINGHAVKRQKLLHLKSGLASDLLSGRKRVTL
jgi:type I restriction enzyme S subunit